MFCVDYQDIYIFIGLLQFRIRDSQEECPPIMCASLPRAELVPLDWVVCCHFDSKFGAQCVTYHKLTESDKSLSTVVTRYSESNVIGLIIINTSNSVSLSENFTKGSIPSMPSVYVVSSEDGPKLQELLRTRDEVQIKVESRNTVHLQHPQTAVTSPTS